VRRLIINADDFGLTDGVNRAIVESHEQGVVTSTTLMANGPSFQDAVALSRNLPKLSVGCHVVLVDGRPLLRAEQVSSLLAPFPNRKILRQGVVREVAATAGTEPQFRDGFGATLTASLRNRLRQDEIELEVAAQIRKLQEAGIGVSHVDTHKHLHMLPGVAEAVIRAARSCGVKAIRNPFIPVRPLAAAHLLRRPGLWTRYTETKILRRFSGDFRRRVADAGMDTTEGSLGIIVTGSLDQQLFRAIMGSVPEGTWEFVCHPGYNDEQLDQVRTRLRISRERELKVLTSDDARKIILDHGIALISYRDLAANQ
jgi:hopanoid biosynthesis associated protein HpnK